ncbi:MAG TPA: penicillin-binding protein 2, partial [Actinomycetales bacterium]
CVVLSLFAAQLLRLQALDASTVAQQALGTRLTTVTVPALRGAILDSDGAVLAASVERWDVVVNQKEVRSWKRFVPSPTDPTKTIKVTLGVADAAAELAPVLGMEVAAVTERLTGTRGYSVVRKAVTPEMWRAVDALNTGGISGVRTSQRVHPSGGLAASITGWFTTDDKPLGGLEQRLDAQLKGKPGSRTFERDPSGRQIATGAIDSTPAVPGKDVRLTIDRDLQWKAEKALADQLKKTDALSGTVVVIEVKTGRILALASGPGFDPAAKGEALSANLRNRALGDIYEPGSTGKVMTAAAALEEGVVTPSTPFTVPYRLVRDGEDYHDSHTHPDERLTFAGVLATSSNTGTIMAGERVPPQTMHDYLTKFGIGVPTGLGFPGESRGLLEKAQDWSSSKRYTVLFGQGLSVNAVQAAGVYQTLANGGVHLDPRLVEGVQNPDGSVQAAPKAKATRVVSEKTADTLVEMLEGVVSDEGTAPEAKIPGYRVAGKTGTAQRYGDECGGYSCGGYTGSFIGLAPADDPELVVAVTLQRPRNGYYGGTVAAPVFRDVMTYALQEKQIPPSGATSPTIDLTPAGG